MTAVGTFRKCRNVRYVVCAVTRRRFPVGASPTRQPLQPEAIGAVMEVTKWLKPSISVSQIGDSASVQAATRVNAEQSSKRTIRRPTRQPFRGRLIHLDEMSEAVRPVAPDRPEQTVHVARALGICDADGENRRREGAPTCHSHQNTIDPEAKRADLRLNTIPLLHHNGPLVGRSRFVSRVKPCVLPFRDFIKGDA